MFVCFDWPPLKPEQDGKSRTVCSVFVHSGFFLLLFPPSFSERGEGVQRLGQCARWSKGVSASATAPVQCRRAAREAEIFRRLTTFVVCKGAERESLAACYIEDIFLRWLHWAYKRSLSQHIFFVSPSALSFFSEPPQAVSCPCV